MPWFSKKQPAVVVEPEVVKRIRTGPALAVLTPDIAGISSFRLSLQDFADDAEDEISKLRADVRRGTHAFWAMHERPAVDEESMHVEALVLIRAKNESDLVYVVSFLDLESALSFTRFEVRRGLYLGNVMVYWAAFAQVREEIEGVTIIPHVAPPSIAEHLLGPDPRLATPLPEPQASLAIEQDSIIQSEARRIAEEYLRENPPIEEPVAIEDTAVVIEPPVIEPKPVLEVPIIIDDEPVTEEAAVADALVLQHPPVAEESIVVADTTAVAEPDLEEPLGPLAPPLPEAEAAQRRQTGYAPKRKWASRDKRRAKEKAPEPQPVAEEEPQVIAEAPEPAAHEEPQIIAEVPEVIAHEEPELVAEVVIHEPLVLAEDPRIAAVEIPDVIAEVPATESEDAIAEREALQAIAQRVTTHTGDEESESALEIVLEAPEIEAKGPAIDPAAGMPQAEKYNEFDIALEVERLLKNRKWETREGPFRGFKSPPGRF